MARLSERIQCEFLLHNLDATQWTAISGMLLAFLTLLVYLDTHSSNRKLFMGEKYEAMLILLNQTIEILQKWQKQFADKSEVIYPRNVVEPSELTRQRDKAELMGVQVGLYGARNIQLIVNGWIFEMMAALAAFNSAYDNPKYDEYAQLYIDSPKASAIGSQSEIHIKNLRAVHLRLTKTTRRDLRFTGRFFRILGSIQWFYLRIKHLIKELFSKKRRVDCPHP